MQNNVGNIPNRRRIAYRNRKGPFTFQSRFIGLADFLGEYRPNCAADHCAVTVTIPKLLHLVEFHYEY